MATSNTEIANIALSHLAHGEEIENLDTENSDPANAIRRFYEISRKKCLRDFIWPFATRIESLVLVEENPNVEWNYSYRYPPNCLFFRRILSGIRTDNRQSRVPYRVAKSSSAKLIFNSLSEPQAEYTENITDVSFFDPDFVMALSFLLAFYAAPRVTAGDPFKLGEKAYAGYLEEISNAKANACNEEQPDHPVESEFVRGREGESAFSRGRD